jgi:hypothetical protein
VLGSVSRVKLRGGVVGKVSLVLIIVCLTIGCLGVYSGSNLTMGGAIAAIVIITFPLLWKLINFAEKNPQAAILEGAEFLSHQKMIMASKDNPVVLNTSEKSASRPTRLTDEGMKSLNLPDQVALPFDDDNKK